MFTRKSLGAMVFLKDKVLLLQNEKHEWVFPLVLSQNCVAPEENIQLLVQGVKDLVGLSVKHLLSLGQTKFEFYSITRRRPICQEISWHLMEVETGEKAYIQLQEDTLYTEVGFFSIEEAIEMVTYSQDRSMLIEAYQRLLQTIYG